MKDRVLKIPKCFSIKTDIKISDLKKAIKKTIEKRQKNVSDSYSIRQTSRKENGESG